MSYLYLYLKKQICILKSKCRATEMHYRFHICFSKNKSKNSKWLQICFVNNIRLYLLLKTQICVLKWHFLFPETNLFSKSKFKFQKANLCFKKQIRVSKNKGWNHFVLKLWDTYPLGVSARLERFEWCGPDWHTAIPVLRRSKRAQFNAVTLQRHRFLARFAG